MCECRHCGRTFHPPQLKIHHKSCTASKPARRVGRVGRLDAAPASPPPATRAAARKKSPPPPLEPLERRSAERRSAAESRLDASASTPPVAGEDVPPWRKKRASDVLRESAPARLLSQRAPRSASPPPPSGPAPRPDGAGRVEALERRAADLERVVRSALAELRDLRGDIAALR